MYGMVLFKADEGLKRSLIPGLGKGQVPELAVFPEILLIMPLDRGLKDKIIDKDKGKVAIKSWNLKGI